MWDLNSNQAVQVAQVTFFPRLNINREKIILSVSRYVMKFGVSCKTNDKTSEILQRIIRILNTISA